MKIPRDISGQDLIKSLNIFGYTVDRQSGSHIRLTTTKNGVHHITIPNHNPLRLGTLSSILSDVGQHFNMSKNDVIEELFK